MRYNQVMEAYRNGDPEICAIMDQNAEHMAYAAQIIADVLNPEAIILGEEPWNLEMNIYGPSEPISNAVWQRL